MIRFLFFHFIICVFCPEYSFLLVSVIVKLSNFTLMREVAPQQGPETQQVW